LARSLCCENSGVNHKTLHPGDYYGHLMPTERQIPSPAFNEAREPSRNFPDAEIYRKKEETYMNGCG